VSGLSKWSRAPDKVIRFGDMPVMLWLKPAEFRALCGEIEISVSSTSSLASKPYSIDVAGGFDNDRFFQRTLLELDEEPDSPFFEAFVLNELEALSRTGELFGNVGHARLE
jgi:hypothetical protein